MANYYNYNTEHMNMPGTSQNGMENWDLKYNLRDKIIAGMELTAIGKRKQIVNGDYLVHRPLYLNRYRHACSFQSES